MYGDTDYGRRDPRPLSFLPSPHNDTLNSTSSSTGPAGEASDPPPSLPRTVSDERTPSPLNSSGRMSSTRSNSSGHENGSISPKLSLRETSPLETANTHFPLNDVDYESSPAAVAQEMVNLQALRRMSMVDNAAGDPDLPSYNPARMPPVAPTGADDDDDASRLFWVPARLHPELAPKEFKSFLETRVDQIKRRSGDEDMLLPDGPLRQNSGSSLRRKKSMLSRQIDNSGGVAAEGYRDGADRLEKKRSSTGQHQQDLTVADLQDLDPAHQDASQLVRKLSVDTVQKGETGGEGGADQDMPILPAAPPGNSLRRSTRTTYRRGSLRKGERVPPSKRAARATEPEADEAPMKSPVSATSQPPTSPPLRVSSEQPPHQDDHADNFSRPSRHARGRGMPGQFSNEAPEDKSFASTPAETPTRANSAAATFAQRKATERAPLPNVRLSAPPIPTTVPKIVETPPLEQEEEPRSPPSFPLQAHIPERVSSHEPPPSLPPQGPLPPGPPKGLRPANRGGLIRQAQNPRGNAQTLSDIVGQPSPLPGNSTRTDSLSFIPTFNDEKKSDKKSKDKKDKDGHEGQKKSGWGWLLGNEEKDKDKEKETSKKSKTKGGKGNDNTRLDLLQTSIDGGRGRESLVLDRESIKLEEERKKESSRKSSGGESKKEKDSGIFSFFGGSKRKGDRESGGKKDRFSRGLSPDPPQRILKPDVDYNWTRFSILEERAIYRMAHIKLANPRRALYSQVLLSNFMYSYLAKVQQMHPQIQIPQAAAQKQRQQQQMPGQRGPMDPDHQQRQDSQYYQYHDVSVVLSCAC